MKKIFLSVFIEKIIRSLLLLIGSFIFIYAVVSQKALLYVHIRHIGIIIFSAIVFFIIGILTMRDAFYFPYHTHSKRKSPLYLIIFLLPIFFYFKSKKKRPVIISILDRAGFWNWKTALWLWMMKPSDAGCLNFI